MTTSRQAKTSSANTATSKKSTKKTKKSPKKTLLPEDVVQQQFTVQVKLTPAELVHIRDLFSVLLPPEATKTLSQSLAEHTGRLLVEARLWQKLSKACVSAAIPLGDDAPDFAVAITSMPSIGVFQVERDESSEASVSETSGLLFESHDS